MTLPPDRERVRQVLSETIGLLCRNGLSFGCQLSVDALIGITVDHKDVFLISIKDTYDSEKNLHRPSNSIAAQMPSDCIEKNCCAKPDSALKCNCPSSMTNVGSCAERNSSSEKQTTSNYCSSAQSCSKRTIDRNEFLGDQRKRARVSVGTSMDDSFQVEPSLLAVVKAEPSDALLDTDTLGALSGAKSPHSSASQWQCTSGTLSGAKSPNCSTSQGQCTSASISLVNSELNSVIDSVRFRIRAPSSNGDTTGREPSDVSCIARESSSDDLPPSNCMHRNKSNEVGSRSASDCNDVVSSFAEQNVSQTVSDHPEANSNSRKSSSLLPSNVHMQNLSAVSRYNSQAPSICHSSHSVIEKPADSDGPSDGLTLDKASDRAESQAGIRRRKSNEVICSSDVESASSDSEVICIKEEIPYLPFHSSASFLADDTRPSLRNSSSTRLKDVALTLSSADSLNLESLSYDRSAGWNGVQNNFFHSVRKQPKDTWNHDNALPSSFTDTQSLERVLTQAAQAILMYDGRYVPLRDIQRLRLCGMAAGQIKLAMEQLSAYDGKLGSFQVLHGGVNLFYKCPPNLVDREILEFSYCIPWETYKFHYDVIPASNITTKHSEQYWLKVAGSSPYDPSNRSFAIA